MGLKVIIPEGTNTTFDNPYMDKENTYKYYKGTSKNFLNSCVNE